jgi:propanol-preferring alcohol dehydrogenase
LIQFNTRGLTIDNLEQFHCSESLGGHIAIQYAKAMGLHVAALDVTEEKLALATQLGANIVVNARAPDAAAQIVKQTGGGAHGVLVTAVSPPAFNQALEGKVRAHIHKAKLADINQVFADLKAGKVDGRIVIDL